MKQLPLRYFCHILFPLVFVIQPLSAEGIDWTRVHETTMRGINLLYNLEMEKALVTFDSVTALAPRDPRGRFFRSMVHFWTYTLKNDEKDYDQFIATSDTVIGICEDLLDRNEKDAVPRFYLGGIYGYRGLALQGRGSILKAVMEGREGYTQLEEAVRLRPDFSDAHMGFGLFRYLVAKIPKGLSWIVGLIGFEGDLEGGLASLRMASEKGVYTRSEASFYLAQFLFNEHRYDEAFALMKTLLERHPENTLFHVQYASWLFRQDKLDDALASLKKATEVNSRKTIRYGEEFIYSTRASIAYTRNDFVAARQFYDMFMQKVTLKNRIPNYTYYRIATARDIAGDRAGALEACRLIKESADNVSRNSAYFLRKGRELSEHPLTLPEIFLLQASNASSRKETDSAAFYYSAALRVTPLSDDVKARAMYGLQQISFDKGSDSAVIAMGKDIVALQPLRETWIIPHAWVKIAQAEARLGRRKEALKALEQAEEYDDYDYQESLERRIEDEREKLNNG